MYQRVRGSGCHKTAINVPRLTKLQTLTIQLLSEDTCRQFSEKLSSASGVRQISLHSGINRTNLHTFNPGLSHYQITPFSPKSMGIVGFYFQNSVNCTPNHHAVMTDMRQYLAIGVYSHDVLANTEW